MVYAGPCSTMQLRVICGLPAVVFTVTVADLGPPAWIDTRVDPFPLPEFGPTDIQAALSVTLQDVFEVIVIVKLSAPVPVL